MTRNLKVFGLVAVAALAIAAMTASAASATVTPFWFRSDAGATGVTKLDAVQDTGTTDVFTVDAGEISCTETTLTGEFTGPTATTITLHPTYGGCTFHGLSATIDVNHCGYLFHTDNRTEAGTPGGKYDVETDVECEHSNEDITVTQISAGVTKCIVHVEQQSLGTGIVLTNAGNAANNTEDITADVNFNNIKYTQTEGSGAGKCATTTTTSNGTYVGKETITGKNANNEATNIWVE
jgi:hypothetical protein